MNFQFETLKIPEVILVTLHQFEDNRGIFSESYKKSVFVNNGIPYDFVQDNYSRSVEGVLRGLHFQAKPQEQGKLVQVVKGKIFDVAVDIRKDSKTFGEWVGVELTDEKPQLLWIPPGFAHGFCVLSDTADVSYKVTAEYAAHLDRGIIWNDPEINVKWPVDKPIVSEKDSGLPFLKDTHA